MKNELHEKVFSFFEDYRKKNPKFTYWLRERNTKGRLDEGMWFQGDGNYVSVGLYNRQSGNLSTQSISFVLREENGEMDGFVEILFKDESDKKVLSLYKEIITKVEGFVQSSPVCYKKSLGKDSLKNIEYFLDNIKPEIDNLIKKNKLDFLFITEDVFQKKFSNIEKYRNLESTGSESIKTLLVNVSWNSNDWKGESNDPSNHGWVKDGGTANESWNFDFNNPRNTKDEIYGFSKFTNTPKISGDSNLLIFHSQNQIVGFYGKAKVIPFDDAPDGNNLIGYRPFCVSLKNKITQVKEKGYLEDGKRIGQGGFNYLKDNSNIEQILNEAILLNPDEKQVLEEIKKWMNLESNLSENYWIFQANPTKTYRIKDALEVGILKEWTVSQQKRKIRLGDKVVLWLSGKEGGIYAIATITSDVYQKEADSEEYEFYTDISKTKLADRVSLKLDFNLIHNPLTKEEVEACIPIDKIISPKQNTNFSLPKDNYTQILKMAINKFKKENPVNQIFYGPPGTGKTYSTIYKAVEICLPELYQKDNYTHNHICPR